MSLITLLVGGMSTFDCGQVEAWLSIRGVAFSQDTNRDCSAYNYWGTLWEMRSRRLGLGTGYG